MSQNIYDNPEFFAGYSQMRRSVEGLSGAPEWPAMQAMLPPLAGARVLDLGCGFGWFCRWAREQGAASVLGLDVSDKMLERAVNETADPAITYQRADLENVKLAADHFDLVYSSLALHYIEHLPELMQQVYHALVPGGYLVCSVEHPIYTAPSHPDWLTEADGRQIWLLDRYLQEGPRLTTWLAAGVIKQHRTIGTYLNLLISLGFTVTRTEEWRPSAEQIAQQPSLAQELERPMFLLFSAQR